jgi:tryptophan 2,3-dioxygenase
MNREQFYAIMSGEGTLDYELYLQTKMLFLCQSPYDQLCNKDELQFQIVHQVEELWMKLIAYTLLDIDEYLQQGNTNRVLTLFRRAHLAQRLMIEQLGLLETMSPKEYQEIRLKLGQGSGQESPGFRTLLKMYQPIWNSFKTNYLDKQGLTVEKIYDSQYSHGDAYMVAEALLEYDDLFQKFRQEHMRLIGRTIGLASKSLKGRSVEILEEGMRQQFFPALWEVRSKMTDKWGATYGVKRDALHGHN